MPLVTPFTLPWRRRRAHQSRMAVQLAVLAVLVVIIVPLYMIYKPQVFLINRLQSRFPQVLFHVPTSRNVVALTIDDAPSEYTRQILDVLEANDATATFFTIGGQVHGRENILQDILQRGNDLGNHAMHDEPSINVPSDRLTAEIEEVDKLIETKGLDAIDRRKAHKMAQRQAHTLADQRYSGGAGWEYARGLQGPAFSYDYDRRAPWGTMGCPSYGWQGGMGYGPPGGMFPPGPPMGAYGGWVNESDQT